jgi:2Fe-2S ferredoxin
VVDSRKKKIIINEASVSVQTSHESSLLEDLLKAKIEIDHSCGGMGSCGTCRIFVDNYEGKIPDANEIEQEMIISRGFSENERLACQIKSECISQIRIPLKKQI